jgi:hypothetical protein
MNTGVRNPRRSFWIAAALFLLGGAAILGGALEMTLAGRESTATGMAIGGGILAAIIGLFMSFNFLWAVRLTDAMRRGEKVIARWTMPPGQFDEFRANDAALRSQGRRNDYKIPRATPAGGVEVIFSQDAVLIGDTFFGLSSTGLARFQSVGLLPGNPVCISFGTVMTMGRVGSAGASFTTITGELRIPVARTANDEARAVLDHYRAVVGRRTIVKPHFWTLRIKIGLYAALIAALVSACGFLLNALKVDLGIVPLIMAVAGAVTALGGLILALLAWRIRAAQFGTAKHR